MARMDRTDRLRVAWVAALAVAVMAGVVASAPVSYTHLTLPTNSRV